MRIWCFETMEKPVAGRLSSMFKFPWEMLFFESKDTEVFKADRNKLFASNEEQIDNHTLLLDMYKYLWCGCCSLLIFVAKKATKGTELQFLCTQGTLQGGRVEDHRLMFTRHLFPPQFHIQAILYIYKTDYIMSLILYTLTPVCKFSILFSIHFLMCW